MALARIDLEDQIERVWGEDYDPRLSALKVIADAGKYLFGMHSWNWRSRPEASLNLVNNQPYVELPSDFGLNGELISLVMSDLTLGVELTTADQISYWHQVDFPATNFYYAAPEYPPQSSTATGPSQPRMFWYPTPASSDAGAVKAIYLSGWVDLTTDASLANIPETFDFLLRRLVRAFAIQEMGDDDSQIELIEKSQFLDRLKRSDAQNQWNVGSVIGGHLMGSGQASHLWNFKTTGVP